MFTVALYRIVKIRKPSKFPITDWIKTLVYIHNGILLGYKSKSCHYCQVDGSGEYYTIYHLKKICASSTRFFYNFLEGEKVCVSLFVIDVFIMRIIMIKILFCKKNTVLHNK